MATHFNATHCQRRSLAAYITLMRAAESVTVRTMPAMTEAGLSISQFGTLEALLHLGPLCQKQIGEKLLKTSGNIVVVIDNLEKRGLVKRQRNTQDRRKVTVSLTEEGSRLIEAVFPKVANSITEEMGVLEVSELEELHRLCRKLGRKLNVKKTDAILVDAVLN